VSEEYEIYEGYEIEAVVAACPDTPTGCRNAAMVYLLWISGLRCAEACDLRPEDIDRHQDTVWVRSGKGNKSRTVVMAKNRLVSFWKLLDAWIDMRSDFAKKHSPLFCNLQGGRIDESYVRRSFGDMAREAGMRRRFHPHGLRHTFAAKMHVAGVPLEIIQRQLGHSDLSVTGAYLKRLGADMVHKAMADFSME